MRRHSKPRYSRLARLLKLRVKEALAPRIEPQDRHRLGLSDSEIKARLRPRQSIEVSPQRLLVLGALGLSPDLRSWDRHIDEQMEGVKFIQWPLRDESGAAVKPKGSEG